ncbi:uncharacterized protein LOC116203985 [Punica granatum]|uniref:Uncharacterized protein LOC116203985 n=2 Tax=Punica granatum TaxID=22663 RepID=A0A6P8DEF0_PUNGR|nr:uncharacterized protein LOC116203985 [Punica granatum]
MAILLAAVSCLRSAPNSKPSLPTQPKRKCRPVPQLRPGIQTRIPAAVKNLTALTGLLGAGFAVALVGPAFAAGDLPFSQLSEPSNALSLPTWVVHVSSVVEWITAMALVWQYGEASGVESWKGLSWGMVPLLGGAFCACTWHFFYNSESLEVLVALQAALTVIGNITMCLAAFRIYRATEKSSKNM